MSATIVTEVSEQAQKFWAPMLKDELLESSILGALVNKEFQGDLVNGGDTVYVSMIQRPTAERKTIGSGADSFNSSKLVTQRVGIVADQRITASFELDNLIDLQTQLGNPSGQSKIRQVLMESLQVSLNDYLYGLVAPSSSAPNHVLTTVTDMNASQLNTIRKLAAQAKWARTGGWYGLVDPSYMSDILNAATLTSSDYVGDNRPIVGGQTAMQRFGFNLLEDNSAGLAGLGTSGEDCGLFFHPDFLYLVMGAPSVKVSDLHSNKQHGYLISMDMWCGAKLGIEGDVKHISVINT